jgi:integrase
MQKKQIPSQFRPKIKFSNEAISSLKIKSEKRIQVKFTDTPGSLSGVSLRYTPNTNKKVFELRYTYKNKDYRICLNEFAEGVYGVNECQEQMLALVKKCKQKNTWIKDPKGFLSYEDTSALTLKEVIEKICEANFPRKTIHGNISAQTQSSYARYLIGYNDRTKHIAFIDNNKGWGEIIFKENSPIKNWGELWEAYPPGVGLKKSSKDFCLYDHKLSQELITEITALDIEHYLEENKKRSYGAKDGIRDALSSLWGFARFNNFLGKNPVNPTKGIILKREEFSTSPISQYNDHYYDETELPLLDKALLKLSKSKPFQAEALMMIMCTGMRKETVCKLRWDMITKDENGNPVIKVSRTVLKGRAKIGQEDEFHDITPPVQRVLNRIKRQLIRKDHFKYSAVPHMFPSTRINKDKLLNLQKYPGYAEGHYTRLKPRTLDDTWRLVKKISGIKEGAVKSLKKSWGTFCDLKLGNRAQRVTKHKTRAVLDRNYVKGKRAEDTILTNTVAKIYSFPKK